MKTLVDAVTKIRKSNGYLKTSEVSTIQSELDRLNIQIDCSSIFECYLKLKVCLKEILALVEREQSNYSGPLISNKIIEEVSAWNRKNLSSEEVPTFESLVSEVLQIYEEMELSDYGWIQFKSKIIGYRWRQQVRQVYKGVTEEEAQTLLRDAPKEMKISKCWEWNQLVERVKGVEWMDDKQIETKLVEHLNLDLQDEDIRQELSQFIKNARISVVSEKTSKKIDVLEELINNVGNETFNSVQELIEKMIEAEFWNTKTFDKYDKVNRILNGLKNYSNQLEEIKESISELTDETLTFKDIAKIERIDIQEASGYIDDFEKLAESVGEGSREYYNALKASFDSVTEIIEANEASFNHIIKKLLECTENGDFEESLEFLQQRLVEYAAQPMRVERYESKLNALDSIVKASMLIRDLGKKEDIKTWEVLRAVVINEQEKLGLEDNCKLLITMEECIEHAKDFISAVDAIRCTSSATPPITFESMERIAEDKRVDDSKVLVDESLIFLDSTIARIKLYRELLDEEKIDLQQIFDGIEFMSNFNIDLASELVRYKQRKERAEALSKKLAEIKKEDIEAQFDQLAEEYTGLGITIPKIDKLFGRVQECKNYVGEAERLLAGGSDYDIWRLHELKNNLIGMEYFRSSNLLGKIFTKYFYRIRELYESNGLDDCVMGNEDETPFTLEYEELRKLVKRAEGLWRRCSDTVRADLKEKATFLNKIYKDVSEHLSKVVHTMSIDEFKTKAPCKLFRNFVNIEAPILEFKQKLELKETQLKESKEAEKEIQVSKKPILGKEITTQIRSFYIKNWTDGMTKNKAFDLTQNNAKTLAKNMEKILFTSNSEDAAGYEKSCDEISRLLKDLVSNQYVSMDIKSKSFTIGCFRSLFGKTPAELRKLNYNNRHKKKVDEQPSRANIMEQKPKMQRQEILVQESLDVAGAIAGEYRYYRVFQGEIHVQDEKIKIVMENAQMITCSASGLISSFAKVPESISITTKVKRDGFEKYVDRLFEPKQSKDYKLLMGWLTIPGGETRVSELLRDRESVASKQYSNTCKIFVFPKEYLKEEWLAKRDFIVMGNQDNQLLYLLVYKKSSKNDEGHKMIPEPLVVTTQKAYKLKVVDGKVRRKNIHLEQLKEIKAVQKPHMPHKPAFIPGYPRQSQIVSLSHPHQMLPQQKHSQQIHHQAPQMMHQRYQSHSIQNVHPQEQRASQQQIYRYQQEPVDAQSQLQASAQESLSRLLKNFGGQGVAETQPIPFKNTTNNGRHHQTHQPTAGGLYQKSDLLSNLQNPANALLQKRVMPQQESVISTLQKKLKTSTEEKSSFLQNAINSIQIAGAQPARKSRLEGIVAGRGNTAYY